MATEPEMCMSHKLNPTNLSQNITFNRSVICAFMTMSESIIHLSSFQVGSHNAKM